MNKTVLITGGSGEIGSAIALRLAATGFDIAVTYLHGKEKAYELANEIAEKYNVKSQAIYLDLTDRKSISSAYDDCAQLLGEPNVLINNAGVESIGLFQDLSDAELVGVLNANLIGSMLLTKRVLPAMLREHSGRIINIASVWGECGASCEVAYSTAKAGLIGFTRALAKECAPSGVLVNAISPGFIDTRMNEHLSEAERAELISSIPASRAGVSDDVARVCEFLVSKSSSYICGQTIRVDGGWI